jgi:hypothetical protein
MAKEVMGTPFTTLQKIFENVTDYNSPQINSLMNSGGKKITLPVVLVSKATEDREEISITGQVSMLPSGENLYGTAVYWFDRTLRDNKVFFSWDKAYVGPGNAAVNPGTYLAGDRMAHAMMGYDRHKSLRDNLQDIKRNYDQRRYGGGIAPELYEQHFDLAASIIADSVVVKSEDLEEILFQQYGGIKKIFGFRPKGLEF